MAAMPFICNGILLFQGDNMLQIFKKNWDIVKYDFSALDSKVGPLNPFGWATKNLS